MARRNTGIRYSRKLTGCLRAKLTVPSGCVSRIGSPKRSGRCVFGRSRSRKGGGSGSWAACGPSIAAISRNGDRKVARVGLIDRRAQQPLQGQASLSCSKSGRKVERSRCEPRNKCSCSSRG
jgi:hypothetical protein